MRVERIDTSCHWIDWCNWLLVKVITTDGLYGWGEASLHGSVRAVREAVDELGEVLARIDLERGVPSVWQELFHAWRWRSGPVLSTALGALDIALWDIEGKRLGVPVYRLLGGPFRTRVRAYASHWLEGVTDEAEAHAQAREAVRRGFTAFKWSPFRAADLRQNETAALSKATALMAAAREGAGDDCDIFVECGEQLSPRTAMRAAELFAPYRPGWFEEPLPFENTRELGELARRIPVPIATGERLLSRASFRELFDLQACSIAQPDVMHAAGITEVMRIAALAEASLVPIAPHNPGGPICTMASLHIAAAVPNFLVLEQMEAERSLRDKISASPLRYVDGMIELPSEPGLGVDIDLELLRDLHPGYSPQPASGLRQTVWH
jgi:galactonate dehydratase